MRLPLTRRKASANGSFRSLELVGYASGYGPKKVLFDIELTVTAGESAALLGPNGAGKTTFLTSIVGGTQVFGGTVILNGEDVTRLAREEFVKRGVAIIPQTGGTFPDLTVGENLKLARLASGRDPKGEIEAEVLATPVLSELAHRKASTLSGGQRQMLAIGRALCCGPNLLLLDEPSVGLAPQAIEAVVSTVEWARERFGLSVLLAEQHLQAASALCSTFHLLKSGRIVRSGEVEGNLADVLGAEYLM